MTYDEALQAFKGAQGVSWAYGSLDIHDRLTQAIEVFKRMKMDLDQCEADLEVYRSI